MRVLILGATGKLGSRTAAALIARRHTTVAFVRTPSKLPPLLLEALAGVRSGDARSASDIKKAIVDHGCDAVVNTAGYAAMAPWGKSDLPAIVDAVIAAAVDVGSERGHPPRVWFLGGQGIMDLPGQKHMIVDYMHLFPEHRITWAKLNALPRSKLIWSILCPGVMQPRSKTTYPFDTSASEENLLAAAGIAPEWSAAFLCTPLVGGYLNIMAQAAAYGTTLEDNADFIAKDLEQGEDSAWIFQKVGVKEK
ncbi:hypothetical protein NKR23_g4968 [Pleurostoma richardsiae]|uniref:NAD(P)-binding domain-containing protein n=1 Tax=Pleurostoma richardsiae TaxID=41990 RepID=A0AA38RU77_9PEZI|nr:hypothetical protein NKR23_g4968 [Pleurostoma richardsiae]